MREPDTASRIPQVPKAYLSGLLSIPSIQPQALVVALMPRLVSDSLADLGGVDASNQNIGHAINGNVCYGHRMSQLVQIHPAST